MDLPNDLIRRVYTVDFQLHFFCKQLKDRTVKIPVVPLGAKPQLLCEKRKDLFRVDTLTRELREFVLFHIRSQPDLKQVKLRHDPAKIIRLGIWHVKIIFPPTESVKKSQPASL